MSNRLRSDATQAIAQAIKRRRFGEPEDFASQLMDAQPDPPIEEEATVALDALLDYLEAHNKKQRQMEWPFSVAEYITMLRVEQ